MSNFDAKIRNIIREELRRSLSEAKCPSCGASGAYHGFDAVECPNRKCRHFSQRQNDEVNGRGPSTMPPTAANVNSIGDIVVIELGHKGETYAQRLNGPFANEDAALDAAYDMSMDAPTEYANANALRRGLIMLKNSGVTHVCDADAQYALIPIDEAIDAL
jgi:hypothetical protein